MDPYRNSTREEPTVEASGDGLAGGDAVICALLLMVGLLGVAVGLLGHRPTEGTIGLLIILLGLLTARDAYRQRAVR